MRRRLLVVLAVAALPTLAGAVPAAAHARLIATDPAGGATVERPPDRVLLTFSERIESTFAGVQVFGPDRERVDSGQPRVEGEQVNVPLQPLTQAGRYTVVFRIISGDGHPVKSQFNFKLDLPAQPEPSEAPTSDATEAPTESASEQSEGETPTPTDAAPEPLEPVGPDEPFELEDAGTGTKVGLWLARLANYIALTAVIGLLVTLLYLLPRAEAEDGTRRRLARAAAVAAAAWAASALILFVFALSTAAARALPEALNGSLMGQFVQTRFGWTVLLQAALAVILALIVLTSRVRVALFVAASIAAIAAMAPAWWGHAGTDELPAIALLSDWSHVLAAAAWVGGLAVLAVVVLRRQEEIDAVGPSRRFSRLAGTALTVVVLTGVVNALLHLGNPENLLGTTWGRLVIAKVVVVGVIAAMGWRNRTRLLPRLGGEDGARARSAFRMMAAAEVAVMLVAFGLATGLASGIPADAEAASRIQSVAGAFGEGQINVTIDPAQVGSNLIHVYFLDNNGRQQEVEDPALTFVSDGEPIEARLFKAGPGHYTVLAQQFTTPGEYEMRLSARTAGERVETTATVTIRP